MAEVSYKWKEIADLAEELRSYRDRELEALCQVWADQRPDIADEQIAEFDRQLAREWSIETGIVEGVYTLSRGVTQTLIERGIDASYIPHNETNRDPELVARIIQSHHDVLDGLFAFVKGDREFTVGYIKELHAALMHYTDVVVVFDSSGNPFETKLEKGTYKKIPNNPQRPDGTIHEYCPPEHVASEMERLVALHRQHAEQSVAPIVQAAWLHHAFTQIHPFPDGNGRVARALASLVLIKAKHFPLVVTRENRTKYIDALETADHGDLIPLLQLFAKLQSKAISNAISHAMELKPAASLDEALNLTRDVLIRTQKITPSEYDAAKDLALQLAVMTGGHLELIAGKLNSDISRADSAYAFSAQTLPIPSERTLRLLSETLLYEPHPEVFHLGRCVTMRSSKGDAEIAVSFHCNGPIFRGLLVGVGYFKQLNQSPVPLMDELFQFNYRDEPAELYDRYWYWLEPVLIQGLAEWRRTLQSGE